MYNNLKVLPTLKKVKEFDNWVNVECKYFCEQNIKPCLEYLDKTLGVKPNFVSLQNANIIAKIDNQIKGYKITIDASGKVIILADSLSSINNAFATITLCAKTSRKKGYIKLPVTEIVDYADTDWRGMSIDVCRRFHPIQYLYKAVDICWLYKINKLQIHFTDDENYTLPSKVLPNLSTKDNHYTFVELKALIEYAKEREITLIPEIDMPGHTTQFMLKYPNIFGKGEIVRLSERVFNAFYRLIDELLELFCFRLIYI